MNKNRKEVLFLTIQYEYNESEKINVPNISYA